MTSLNKWDVRLLNKHLTRYKKLETGQVEPSSANERHFVDVFVNGHHPVTQHEVAYSRYKAEQLTAETLKASTAVEYNNDDEAIEENETTVDTLDEVLISAEQASEKFSLASRLRQHYQTKRPTKIDLSTNAMVWMNFLMPGGSVSA